MAILFHAGRVNKQTLKLSPIWLVILFVIGLYFASHWVNFGFTPWNQNGLFDDAAWDIYFAKTHVFAGLPFQAAYFDSVGVISREVVFHYYISIFFKLFGYNLLIFNFALLILGFITVLFTILIVHHLFKNNFVTVAAALSLNFFPLHYLHTFAGHRYAIAAPLMMVSLYFLYTAVDNHSRLRAVISAIFAALCLGSAVMGKQYLYGLILAALCLLVTRGIIPKIKKNISLLVIWIISFGIAALPMFIYIASAGPLYMIRESGLLKEFLDKFRAGGWLGIQPYFSQMKEIFFAAHSSRRWFLPDFPVIPYAYYLLIGPGLIIAWFKKRFEIVFLATIPVGAAFLAGGYDFRVLLAAPIWVIAVAFTFNFLVTSPPKKYIPITASLALVVLTLGLIPSVNYLWSVAKNPNSLWLLPHKDVAVSRLIQDIAAGMPNPNSRMKWDEFNRKANLAPTTYDTFAAPQSAYAIAHLYLQNFDDHKILSFIDEGTQQLATPEQILEFNSKAIEGYVPNGRDLKLIWEESDKTDNIIRLFSQYNKYGEDQTITDTVDDISFSLYVLTIKNENIEKFKNEVATLR